MSKNYVTISSIKEQIKNYINSQPVAGISLFKTFTYDEQAMTIGSDTIANIIALNLPINDASKLTNSILHATAKNILLKDLQPFAFRKITPAKYLFSFDKLPKYDDALFDTNVYIGKFKSIINEGLKNKYIQDKSTLYIYKYLNKPFRSLSLQSKIISLKDILNNVSIQDIPYSVDLKNLYYLADLDYYEDSELDNDVLQKAITTIYNNAKNDKELCYNLIQTLYLDNLNFVNDNLAFKKLESLFNLPDPRNINNLQLINALPTAAAYRNR